MCKRVRPRTGPSPHDHVSCFMFVTRADQRSLSRSVENRLVSRSVGHESSPVSRSVSLSSSPDGRESSRVLADSDFCIFEYLCRPGGGRGSTHDLSGFVSCSCCCVLISLKSLDCIGYVDQLSPLGSCLTDASMNFRLIFFKHESTHSDPPRRRGLKLCTALYQLSQFSAL